MLLDAVERVRAGGDPPGLDGDYRGLRVAVGTLPASDDWRAALAGEGERATAPA
jgi:hypothetical protein